MKSSIFVAIFVLAVSILASPSRPPGATDFSGTWTLNVAKSKDIGMMSSMEITLKIRQAGNEIIVSELSKFNGQEQTRELRYDLNGKPVANSGPMGDPNQTVTKWVGSTLQTTWTQEGAVAGTKIVRTETRSLSGDGKIMNDEYVRKDNPPTVLVFEKQSSVSPGTKSAHSD